jgi:hypothetical protein
MARKVLSSKASTGSSALGTGRLVGGREGDSGRGDAAADDGGDILIIFPREADSYVSGCSGVCADVAAGPILIRGCEASEGGEAGVCSSALVAG